MKSSHSSYSTQSSSISNSSDASIDSYGENILEDNGRISLAYENLRTIPKRIAEKFAAHTKCLDLSYNNFQNLSFLSFFEALDTLILDRNAHLNVNTFPYLPNLRILWINNCDISNVALWVDRISMQCPQLEHLSIMGNPGVSANFSFCPITSNTPNSLEPTSTIVCDFREYVLNVLPHLQVLDGVPQHSAATSFVHQLSSSKPSNYNNHSFKIPATTSFNNGIKSLNGTNAATAVITKNSNSQSDNIFFGSRNSSSSCSKNSHIHQISCNNKHSPTLSFKEIFRLKRRKKSYQSSSTN